MILSVQHICKSFSEVPVLTDITFHLERGDRCAVVGINGAGKSTLLKIMTGEIKADEGAVSYARDTTLGYLAQNQDIGSGGTIYEELLSVKKELVELEKKIALDEELMTRLTGDELNRLIEEYNDRLARFRNENGFSYKGEITGVLRGLGFHDEEFGQPIHTLSGGQKTRVALAKLLLEKPDVILLDEPTNHLDIAAIRWLETYLANYKGTVLIVSHDRYFLDKTVNHIIEIENTRALMFHGNYSFYAEEKQKLREQQWHQYLNNQAELRHQEEVIAKLKQFNREKSIKRAESRQKQLAKKEVLEKPVELRDDMRLSLKPCIRSGRDVMQVRHLSMAFEDKRLFEDITFDLLRGEHAAIIGDNGTGKSTLLKIIIGQLQALSGTVRFGTNVHVGYYDQEHHVLNDANTVFEEIADAYPDMTNTEIRNLLASFLFTGEDVFKRIADLSGGEKGRVSLAKLMLSEANLLILDEPTNHLDMVSKEVLENALNSYEGTVLYVSHDRYFMNRTASRILSLTGQLMLNYPGGHAGEPAPACYLGNYDYYLEKAAQVEDALRRDEIRRIAEAAGKSPSEIAEALGKSETAGKESDLQADRLSPASPAGEISPSREVSSTSGTPAASGSQDYRKQKEEQAKLRKLQNDIKKCEAEIAQLEERNTGIDEEMALPENCTNLERLAALQKEKSANEERLETLYPKWEELSEALG